MSHKFLGVVSALSVTADKLNQNHSFQVTLSFYRLYKNLFITGGCWTHLCLRSCTQGVAIETANSQL